jgi:heptosyltransferase I
MADILFIKTSSLGDVIHHMPALADARSFFPDARIAWIVEEAYAPLVALHTAVDDVFAVAARRWRHGFTLAATWRAIRSFASEVRARRYDTIIDTQGLIRSAVITRLARGQRHGYDSSSIREPLACLAYDVRHRVERQRHAIVRNRMLTALTLGYTAPNTIDFGLARDALRERTQRPYSILFHSTARPEKEWPEAHWVELGKALAASGHALLLPWGSELEQARSIRLAEQIPGASVPPRRPLDAMARLVAGASFVVGVDTGLLHLAAALGVPLVAIFVASEPGLTGPMGQGPIAIVGSKALTPSVEEVLGALKQMSNGA